MITVTKAVGIWLLMVVAAILNAALREKVLLPLFGIRAALPLSGIVLSGLVFVITLLCIQFINSPDGSTYLGIGLLWVTLTVAFEFIFGHYVLGKSWEEIVQIFNITKGDLFSLVLVTSAVSPWLCAKLRGLL
jgi:hypothetical protein